MENDGTNATGNIPSDFGEFIKWIKKREQEIGLYATSAEIQFMGDKNSQLLHKALRLLAVPTRFDPDLAKKIFRDVLNIKDEILFEEIYYKIRDMSFISRFPGPECRMHTSAREFFNQELCDNDLGTYIKANEAIVSYLAQQLRDVSAGKIKASAYELKNFKFRLAYHLLATNSELGIIYLHALVCGNTNAPEEELKAYLWTALNQCKYRRGFIPVSRQKLVDEFRDKYISLGGKFDPIIVGTK